MSYEHMIELRKRLGKRDAGMLLDVAVGKGEFLRFVLGAFRTWKGAAGIDISSDALAVAREALMHFPVTLVTGSALAMPFPDQLFDTVTISNSLHHMEDLEGLLAEAGRVCRTGGTIVINEMVCDQVTSMRENHMLYHNLIAEIDNRMGHYHRQIYNRSELAAVIRKSGLHVIEHFDHEEKTDEFTRQEDIDQLVASLQRRMEMLRNTEHYYFYENKAKEIIHRLKTQGFHKPSHAAYFLRPSHRRTA